jgi:hypothetical protein
MKLKIFQSSKGDCLLLVGNDDTHVLCDGGMTKSMTASVRAELAKLRRKNIKLDTVYVSHIDQDHISGVLQLLDDELSWRLYDHHKAAGTPIAKPKVPRPPEIGRLWHNAFRDQVGQNADRVEDLLAAAAPSLLATGDPSRVRLGIEYQQLAFSIKEAIQVSQLASPKLLKIPVNVLPGANGPARLLMARKNQPAFVVGSMTFTIIGPRAGELENLKKGWNDWLETSEGEQAVAKLRREIRDKIDRFGTSDAIATDWSVPSYKGVTPPNVASLMFMVEENGKRLLLTGDSHQDMIIDGLESTGFLQPGQGFHVDVLKVQHHGSEHNYDPDFAQRVSADHYVFCGNGENGNPELAVIDMITEARLGKPSLRALAPQAQGRPFKFWFSTTSAAQRQGSRERRAFAKMEAHVANLVQQSGGMLTAVYNTGASVTLSI